MHIMAIINSIKVKSIYKKANRILKACGGEYCTLMGINSPSFKGFEKLDIEKHHETGTLPKDRMLIKVDGTLVYFVEVKKSIINTYFHVTKYTPGNWEKVLDDKDFLS